MLVIAWPDAWPDSELAEEALEMSMAIFPSF
jgi:hypothetical protein